MYYTDVEKIVSKLTKNELVHLVYVLGTEKEILAKVKKCRDLQHKLSPEREECWECRSIARKLGVEQ